MSTKCVLISYTTLSQTACCKDSRARYEQQCTIFFFTYSTSDSCPILMKVGFSRQIFQKYSNIKFHYHPSSGSRDFPCGQTDGHEDSFRNFAKTPKKLKATYTRLPKKAIKDLIHVTGRAGSSDLDTGIDIVRFL